MPDFSVIVPLYNKGPHIVATLNSALRQTLLPAEIIVVDDGSSDNGLEQVRALAHPAIRIFERSSPGPGGYAARNLGIFEARGDWIALLDADDVWLDDHLALLAAAIDGCERPPGYAFSGVDIVTGPARRPYRHDAKLAESGSLDLCTMLRSWLATERCPVWTIAAAFRRDVLLASGLFPAGRARRGGDKDLWLRVMAIADGVFAPKRTAEFHQDSVNRVTKMTGHSALPLIATTIAEMLPSRSAEERSLLRALANMEVRLYCRHAAGGGAPINWAALGALHYPRGLTDIPSLLAYAAYAPVRRRSLSARGDA